jgi:2-methylcitrate dehydratase PrpD
MVKRLHFGRGAEGGVLAALLAAEGFDGPHNVLEGRNGFLRVFCDEYDLSELTLGLDGSIFRMREVAMKRFGTHGTSQVPLQALLELRTQHPFTAEAIDTIHIAAAPENVAHHDHPSPTDLMQAQYSVPFCVAVACVRDIRDPRAMDESALTDPQIQAVVQRIRYEAGDISDKRACELTVTLKNGAVLRRTLPESGTEWRPANRDETYEKYAILMRDCPQGHTDALFERIQMLEDQADLAWLEI